MADGREQTVSINMQRPITVQTQQKMSANVIVPVLSLRLLFLFDGYRGGAANNSKTTAARWKDWTCVDCGRWLGRC
jgi:hypothetical protein